MGAFERMEKRQRNIGKLVCKYSRRTADELFELSQSEKLKAAFDEGITVFLSDLNYYRSAGLIRLVKAVDPNQRVREVYEGTPTLYTQLMLADNLEFRFEGIDTAPIAAYSPSGNGMGHGTVFYGGG